MNDAEGSPNSVYSEKKRCRKRATIEIEIARKMYIPLHDHNGNITCLLNDKECEETYVTVLWEDSFTI